MSSTANAPRKDWSRKALLEVLDADTVEAGLARLRKLGVLDEHNHLTERATSWGKDYVSYTHVEGDDEPQAPEQPQRADK